MLEGFFNHPSHNGHVRREKEERAESKIVGFIDWNGGGLFHLQFAFSDVVNKVLYTTKNYGAEFAAEKVDFVPDKVLFDPHSDNNIVAYEQTTKEKRVCNSINDTIFKY